MRHKPDVGVHEREKKPEIVRPEGVPPDAIASVFVVRPEFAGLRLDLWLSRELPRLSRTRAQQIVSQWAFTADGRSLSAAHRVRLAETIAVYRPRWDEPPAPREVTVLHADPDVIAVDKPSGLPVHPTARYHDNTLTAVLKEKFPGERVVLAHRLDRETSGVLLLARTPDAERHLKRAFATRTVHKTYQAIVYGHPPEDHFVSDAPLALHGGEVSVKMCVRPVSKGGAPSRTRFDVLERLDGYSRVACSPETGRQHQIRVHLAALGHPIVGDKLYTHGDSVFLRALDHPDDPELLSLLQLPRHALHAWTIHFDHPRDNRLLTLTAPLPQDLLRFCLRHSLQVLDP